MRRLLGTMLLAVAAGTVTPAAAAAAVVQPATGPVQRFAPARRCPGLRGEQPARAAVHHRLPADRNHDPRRIYVENDETRTARFTVYPDAAQISNELFTGDAGATRNELTGWISVQHPVLTLSPGASVMDTVTIKVPLGATRGEHYAVIWVQQESYARGANGFATTRFCPGSESASTWPSAAAAPRRRASPSPR